jgi:hypothetical protein
LPTTSITASYSSGVLQVSIVYVQSIQNISASLSLSPPIFFDNTFSMKNSSTSFTVNP